MAEDWANQGSAPTDPTENARWHRERGEAQRRAEQQQAPQPTFVPTTIPTSTTGGGGGATGAHPYEQYEWMGKLAVFLAVAGFAVGAFLAGGAGADAHGFWGAVIWGFFGGVAFAVAGWFAPVLVYGVGAIAIGLAIIAAVIFAIFWIVSLF